jgi:hypothetical protein
MRMRETEGGSSAILHEPFAATDDSHPTQLSWGLLLGNEADMPLGVTIVPLWNFSSIGGTIMRTLTRRSLAD